ncbi:TPA: hypothetical protein M4K80_000279 [Salmonella enterica]|nr:hypothetical protein [Salmonella enterica]
MIKILFITILGAISLAAARYSPVTVINAPARAIARCLADNLYQHGYSVDLQETDIPGIDKEFTVYCPNSATIAGTFWIASSITNAPDKTVGMYGISKQAAVVFNRSLQQCAVNLSIR